MCVFEGEGERALFGASDMSNSLILGENITNYWHAAS